MPRLLRLRVSTKAIVLLIVCVQLTSGRTIKQSKYKIVRDPQISRCGQARTEVQSCVSASMAAFTETVLKMKTHFNFLDAPTVLKKCLNEHQCVVLKPGQPNPWTWQDVDQPSIHPSDEPAAAAQAKADKEDDNYDLPDHDIAGNRLPKWISDRNMNDCIADQKEKRMEFLTKCLDKVGDVPVPQVRQKYKKPSKMKQFVKEYKTRYDKNNPTAPIVKKAKPERLTSDDGREKEDKDDENGDENEDKTNEDEFTRLNGNPRSTGNSANVKNLIELLAYTTSDLRRVFLDSCGLREKALDVLRCMKTDIGLEMMSLVSRRNEIRVGLCKIMDKCDKENGLDFQCAASPPRRRILEEQCHCKKTHLQQSVATCARTFNYFMPDTLEHKCERATLHDNGEDFYKDEDNPWQHNTTLGIGISDFCGWDFDWAVLERKLKVRHRLPWLVED